MLCCGKGVNILCSSIGLDLLFVACDGMKLRKNNCVFVVLCCGETGRILKYCVVLVLLIFYEYCNVPLFFLI